MRLDRWLILIAGMVVLGAAQVAQHHALYRQGYAVGASMKQVHEQQTNVGWLGARVAGLMGPAHLAALVDRQHLTLVARATLSKGEPESSVQSTVQLAAASLRREDGQQDVGD